jgi:uncharacterized protein (DUF305 family)
LNRICSSLKTDNDELKAAAQKVIDDQTKEIEELTAWIEKEVK